MGTKAEVVSFPQTPKTGKSPKRRRNAEVRSREYLTEDEVQALVKAAKVTGRHGHRDATLILVAYRHGLRVSELVALRWDQVDLKQGLLYVRRLKNGTPSTHPLRGSEIRALRKLQRESHQSPYVFVTERQGPLTSSTVRKLVASPSLYNAQQEYLANLASANAVPADSKHFFAVSKNGIA